MNAPISPLVDIIATCTNFKLNCMLLFQGMLYQLLSKTRRNQATNNFEQVMDITYFRCILSIYLIYFLKETTKFFANHFYIIFSYSSHANINLSKLCTFRLMQLFTRKYIKNSKGGEEM